MRASSSGPRSKPTQISVATFVGGIAVGFLAAVAFSNPFSQGELQCETRTADNFFESMTSANAEKDAMLKQCKDEFDNYISQMEALERLEGVGIDDTEGVTAEGVDSSDKDDGDGLGALPDIWGAVDTLGQLSIGNSDVERAKQTCRWSSNQFDPSPYISGDAFRHFSDFQFSRWYKEKPGCNLTGDEPFFPGCLIYVKSDYTVPFFKTIHPKITVPYVLVTHDSDYEVPVNGHARWEGLTEIEEINSNSMTAWFGQNMKSDYNPEKLFHIPIGIQNVNWLNPEVYSKFVLQGETSDRSECLAFSSWRDTTGYRKGDDLKYVKGLSDTDPQFVTWQGSHDEWLQYVLKCKYVVCPRGNGLDTHRHWEAMMLGAVPVTTKGTLDPLYSEMPMLILDSFYNVSKELLEERYPALKERLDKERPKAFISYWLRKIRAKQIEAANMYDDAWQP